MVLVVQAGEVKILNQSVKGRAGWTHTHPMSPSPIPPALASPDTPQGKRNIDRIDKKKIKGRIGDKTRDGKKTRKREDKGRN